MSASTSSLEFSTARDVTTGALDRTRRVAFTVNDHVIVHVAVEQPAEGWVAGRIVVQTLTVPSESQLATLRALGVLDLGGLLEVDVPGRLWARFIDRLRGVGAPV